MVMTCKACLRRIVAAERLACPSPRSTIARSISTSRPSNVAGPSTPSRVLTHSVSHRWSRSYITTHSSVPPSTIPRTSTPFRRTAATLAQAVEPSHTTPQTPIDVIPPSLDAIKEEGYLDDDVALIPPEEAWLNITPAAVSQLEKITLKEPADVLAQNKLALRVGVESGGCHGFQYTMELVEDRGVDDYVMQPKGVSCIPVIVDLTSLGLLKGATLHHATELIGSSFRLQDNPQAKEGGNCGCGVSWELK